MIHNVRRFVLSLVLCYFVFVFFSVLLTLRFGKRELIFVLFVRLFGLPLFGFVCFLFLLVSGKGCGLWLWNLISIVWTSSVTSISHVWLPVWKFGLNYSLLYWHRQGLWIPAKIQISITKRARYFRSFRGWELNKACVYAPLFLIYGNYIGMLCE